MTLTLANKIMNLEQIKERAENLMSSWSGEETTFMHEGDIYNEEDVSTCEEIVQKVNELQELLKEVSI